MRNRVSQPSGSVEFFVCLISSNIHLWNNLLLFGWDRPDTVHCIPYWAQTTTVWFFFLNMETLNSTVCFKVLVNWTDLCKLNHTNKMMKVTVCKDTRVSVVTKEFGFKPGAVSSFCLTAQLRSAYLRLLRNLMDGVGRKRVNLALQNNLWF